MIGVFDSGYGGLTILRALVERLSAYDYLYLGDNARAPYGPRSSEEIYTLTREGVAWLFGQGCELVILGCNTASANALRRLQQEWLPHHHPTKRVLGILVPTVESIGEHEREGVIVLATEATVRARSYTVEIQHRHPDLAVFERACSRIVPLIESGATIETLKAEVDACTRDLPQNTGTAILGCTHYALVAELFRAALAPRRVFDQAGVVAQKTEEYLERHPDIRNRLSRSGARRFATTAVAADVEALAGRFWGSPVSFETVTLQEITDSL